MIRYRMLVALAAIAVTNLANQVKAVPIAYAISNTRTSLISFDVANPGGASVVGPFSGAVANLDVIAFRPANGLLYGYNSHVNSLVTVNPLTSVTTFVSTPSARPSYSAKVADFDPVSDELRLIGSFGQNFRINVDTGVAIVDRLLAYRTGDLNFEQPTNIVNGAYTNSDTNSATATTLYFIDNRLGTLVTATDPNGGVLSTVGSLGVDGTFVDAGFEIHSDGFGGNTAYALLTPFVSPLSTNLYTVNLSTGNATLVGGLGLQAHGAFGLAIFQPTVPEPSSMLIVIGLSTFGLRFRSRGRRFEMSNFRIEI